MFRWLFILVLISNISISGYFRRKARSEETIARKEEGGPMVILRLVFALPLFLSFLVFMIYPPWMAWSSVPLPVWLRWVGVALGVLSIPCIYMVFKTIGSNISETVLTK